MISTLLPCIILSLSIGEIRTIPVGMKVSEPGKLNWYIGDRLIPIAKPTTAMVLRLRPEGVDRVVEVKLLDGSNRLGWLVPSSPVEALVASAPTPSPKIEPAKELGAPTSAAIKPYAPPPRRKRRYPRQDHTAIMAMTYGLMFSAQSSMVGGGGFGSSSGTGNAKTQWVNPYNRANGTHVNGYWRSPPSR